MSAETFVARLDRVPLNRFHWRLLITSGLGWMFDAMDVLLIGFLVAPITKEFALAPAQVGFVASAGFVGMFLGAAISGRLADRYGRRLIFQATLVMRRWLSGAPTERLSSSFATEPLPIATAFAAVVLALGPSAVASDPVALAPSP